MNIQAVSFKREKGGPLEFGVIINFNQLILDEKGKPVKKTWSYELEPWKGCINFSFPK